MLDEPLQRFGRAILDRHPDTIDHSRALDVGAASPQLDLVVQRGSQQLADAVDGEVVGDAVQQAESGHPGTPMALAPLAWLLWTRHLRYDPRTLERFLDDAAPLGLPAVAYAESNDTVYAFGGSPNTNDATVATIRRIVDGYPGMERDVQAYLRYLANHPETARTVATRRPWRVTVARA